MKKEVPPSRKLQEHEYEKQSLKEDKPSLRVFQKSVSNKARASGEFDSRKNPQPAKLERRPLISVNLSFRNL